MICKVLGWKKLSLGLAAGAFLVISASSATAQTEEHHRKGYKPLPDLAHIVVTVEKGFNGKPLENAAVIFHATRDDRDDGNLEVKTDPDGKATIDLIEVGSKVTVQVLANGFATYATDFNVDSTTKELTVVLERPKEQVSTYEDNGGKESARTAGTQEPPHAASTSTIAAPAGTSTAKLSGTLRDASGARIPGAVLRLKLRGTNAALISLVTGNDGMFHAATLLPGTYDVTITSPGFAQMTKLGVVLLRADNMVLDLTLQPEAK